MKDGGERTGTFEIVDVDRRNVLQDALPRGYLRGFAFAADSKSFYYVHETHTSTRPHYRAAYHHVLGTGFADDKEVFFAGESDKLRLSIIPSNEQLAFLVFHFLEKTLTDLYLWPVDSDDAPELIISRAEYQFGPLLLKDGRILALTDREAPNFRIVEVLPRPGQEPEFRDVVPTSDSAIQSWSIAGERIFVSYIRGLGTEIDIFDFSGRREGLLPTQRADSVRLLSGSTEGDELLFEQESFTKPTQIYRYSPRSTEVQLWAERSVPFEAKDFCNTQVWFTARDGIRIPMFLVGREDVLAHGAHAAIMTSYGGHGVAMTPQFSVFVAFLLERGCLFALPNIRGGSEFGIEWHHAAKRRNRQVAFDDFLSAAEWLIETGRTERQTLAIFGGSNSGLLVAAAMTQRPDLFGAVVCIAPLLDMLRYHLFDNAYVWKDEFGTVDDPDDFAALHEYSPYHRVCDRTSYPAIMLVAGDRDQKCNSLHARKMTARLQAANISDKPIFLDYGPQRGHSPVLPLSARCQALTDRMAFLCDQLNLTV